MQAGSISFLLIRELLIFIALKQSAYYAATNSYNSKT